MARTTADEVKQILDNSQLTDAVIDAYIAGANALVTQVLGSSSLSATLLEQIEMWLTAHMISVTRERMGAKEEAGGAKIEYTGTYGQSLKSSPYGQTVLILDTTGGMAGLGGMAATTFAIPSFE